MKKIICFLLMLLQARAYAQTKSIDSSAADDFATSAYSLSKAVDSLKHLVQTGKSDTARSEAFYLLSLEYLYSQPDTALLLAQQGLALARQTGYVKAEADNLTELGNVFLVTGNDAKALEMYLAALKKAEAVHYSDGIMDAVCNIGNVYYDQEDYPKTLSYAQRYKNLAVASRNELSIENAFLNLGGVYAKLNHLDSAMHYTSLAYDYVVKLKDPVAIGIVLNNFGNIYSKMKEPSIAMDNYRRGFAYAMNENDANGICESTLGMANLFLQNGQTDSALHYARISYATAKRNNYISEMFPAANFLADCYKQQNVTDSAYYYLSAMIAAKDSLYSREKVNAIQNLTFDEAMRQQEIKQQVKEAKIHFQNQLKFAALFAGIFCLLVIAYFLYRNNRHRKKAYNLLQKQKMETDSQKQKVEKALEELKTRQAQLIQSEKMASLGQLTAGIAHEIQNPLNFVNNFSEVNKELIGELKTERLKPETERDEQIENETLNDIDENEEKINHHGKRADAIVKAMLQHSRVSTGVKEQTDVNALCDEYLRLSYHGLRAKNKAFKAGCETDFDTNIGKINIVPQDIGRVLLNVFNNAFYAISEKQKSTGNNYEPKVTVVTKRTTISGRESGNAVLISIKDNGSGIPENIIGKIFQPFFTTKPTGQGVGLGLSLSYDIVKANNGNMNVETKEGNGTEFIIELPLNE